MRWLVLVVALACLPGPPAASAPEKDREASYGELPRLRTFDLRLVELIRKGYVQSPTFKQLVDTIERSNVIVHVERHNRFHEQEAGRLRIAGEAGGLRYLQISLNSVLSERELMVFMAHELQHAVEVAKAPDVVDEQGLKQLYCQIGTRRQYGFDTRAARRVTEQVSAELKHNPER